MVACVRAKSDHIVKIGAKVLRLSATEWVFRESEQPAVTANFESTRRSKSTQFSQELTIFKVPMSADRRDGLHVSTSEYVEAFVVHENAVTIQVRVDRGSYWVLTRETFKADRPMLIDVSRIIRLPTPEQERALVDAYRAEVDAARAWINNNL